MKIWNRSLAVATASSLFLSLGALSATADFPDRPIEFVIPFGAGGGADIEGRLLAKEMIKR